MDISVIGAGYVGLTTGISFVEFGNKVKFIDVDENKINKVGLILTEYFSLPVYTMDVPGDHSLFVKVNFGKSPVVDHQSKALIETAYSGHPCLYCR